MRIIIASIVLFSLSGFITSCSIAGKSSSLEKALVQFMSKNGVDDTDIICDISGRVGQCIFNKTSESLEKIVEQSNLRDFESEEIKDNFKYYNYWIDYKERRQRYDVAYTCGSLQTFNNLKLVKVYGNLDKSPKLTIKDVGTFDKFFLFYRSDTDDACIHFTHAYG